MKLPINWLKDYVKIPDNPKVLIDKLTAIGHMQDGPAKEVAGDVVYDLEIRQNRSDCLAILGLAMEASAVLNEKFTMPELGTLPPVTSKLKVTIENPDQCIRFETITIEHIKIGPSPDWMKNKLEAYGIKSINNVVDITNFVMVEMGEPMHAYDVREVEGGMSIRQAKKGEKLVILGGKEVALTLEDLIIADSKKVLSIAGVIGGEHSSIKDDTTTIILEDATYNQASIRRTSIRHQVRTEASTRHEKFLHPIMTTVALQRAAKLYEEICGGTVVDHTDNYPKPFGEKWITFHEDHLQKLGGVHISASQAAEILTKLQMDVKKVSEKELKVGIPCARTDVVLEEDLIEEVLRIYGYDNIPATLPSTPPPKDLQNVSTHDIEETVKDLLTAAGYDEQITEPLTTEEKSELPPVTLENSLNAAKTMLRTSMKKSLMAAFANQQKYRKTDIRLFEVGKIYYKQNEEYKEEKVLAGVSSYPTNSYMHAKGVLEIVFERLNRKFNENVIKIEPVGATTFYFELKLQDILKQPEIPFNFNIFTQPPQVILQDLSLHAPESVKVGDVIKAVYKASHLVYKVKLGEPPQKMPEGGKSIFLNVTFYSSTNPISNQDVENERREIANALLQDYKIRIR